MRDRGGKDCQNAPRFLAVRGFQDATIWCPCSAHKILWKTSNLYCSSLGVSHTLLGTFQQTKLLTRLSRDLQERGLKLIA